MRQIHITLDDAVLGITNVVRKYGADHTSGGGSNGCIYAARDQYGALVPVCIVGQFVANYGLLGALVIGDGFSEPEQYGACEVGSEMWDRLEEHGMTVTPEARAFLREAQASQDAGKDWGTALLKAWQGVKDTANYHTRNGVIAVVGNHTVPASEFV